MKMSIPDKDYSNTIVYKITCKDPSIQDVYVGHTVNFVQRKKAHQLSCMNSKYPNHNCKVYKVMRNNGGWDNWNMDIVAFYKCNDLNEARQKEQEHFVALNATMNSVEPFPSKSVRTIRIIKPVRPVRPVRHVRPVRQNKSTYNENMPISAFNRPNVCYSCEPCDFTTDNKTDYERHLTRKKHIEKTQYCEQMSSKPDPNKCPSCNKLFKHRTSVYKHIIRCKPVSSQPSIITTPSTAIPDIPVIPNTFTPTSILSTTTASVPTTPFEKYLCELTNNFTSAMTMMIQQNAELQNKIMEMCKNDGTSNTPPTNTPFNMNRFLNEQCKDAMNMTDFVNSIQLTLTDLENVGRLGYAKGMSNILIDNLQKMDVYKRPVHCSDAKRETLYVKDNNEWERDGPRHPKMANAVRMLEEKNDALIEEWANQHPNCMNDNTRDNKQYLKIRNAITLGSIANVICRVAKTIVIEK